MVSPLISVRVVNVDWYLSDEEQASRGGACLRLYTQGTESMLASSRGKSAAVSSAMPYLNRVSPAALCSKVLVRTYCTNAATDNEHPIFAPDVEQALPYFMIRPMDDDDNTSVRARFEDPVMLQSMLPELEQATEAAMAVSAGRAGAPPASSQDQGQPPTSAGAAAQSRRSKAQMKRVFAQLEVVRGVPFYGYCGDEKLFVKVRPFPAKRRCMLSSRGERIAIPAMHLNLASLPRSRNLLDKYVRLHCNVEGAEDT